MPESEEKDIETTPAVPVECVKTPEGSRLLKLVEEFDKDCRKLNEKGNKSAGVRARKKLMELRRLATAIKAELLAKSPGEEEGQEP